MRRTGLVAALFVVVHAHRLHHVRAPPLPHLRGGSSTLGRLRGGDTTRHNKMGDTPSTKLDQLSSSELNELFRRATQLKPDVCTDSGTRQRREVLPSWSGKSSWLWRQWRGTILEATWERMLGALAISAGIIAVTLYTAPAESRWPIWAAPDPLHPFVQRLKLVHTMWTYLLTISTFVTTFMIGHAYTFWQRSYGLARSIQGRLSDLGLLCATTAARETGADRPGECFSPGPYTPAARDLIALTIRRLALTHILFWASIVRHAPGSDRFGTSFNMLLSTPALDHLRDRGALTPTEHDALLSLTDRPKRSLYLCVLAWVMSDLSQGLREGVLLGGSGAESALFSSISAFRSNAGQVADDLAARMPLAYVHFVQVLTDTLCVTAPFALYPIGGGAAVVLSMIMSFFFSGILELCKSLLDPFGTRRVSNCNFRADIQIDVLLAETNGNLVLWPRRLLALHDATTSSMPMSVPLADTSASPATEDDEAPGSA